MTGSDDYYPRIPLPAADRAELQAFAETCEPPPVRRLFVPPPEPVWHGGTRQRRVRSHGGGDLSPHAGTDALPRIRVGAAVAVAFLAGNLLTALLLHADGWAPTLAWLAGFTCLVGAAADLTLHLRARKVPRRREARP